jgi:hypothetical protein
MYASQDLDHCFLCKAGRIVRADQEIAFKQRTKKGYIFCHVIVPVDTCEGCGLKSWGHDAEAIVEDAVWQEYMRLSAAAKPTERILAEEKIAISRN